MEREKIIAQIARLEPWFHQIELKDSITTKTESVAGEPKDHPVGTWKTIAKCLAEDLSNKTVLDIGCNAGFGTNLSLQAFNFRSRKAFSSNEGIVDS